MNAQVVDTSLPIGYSRREEVMNALGISIATVERMTRDERLHSKLIFVPGRKGERVYLDADVERLKALKEKRAALKPPSAQKLLNGGVDSNGGATIIKTTPGFTLDSLRELMQEWASLRQAAPEVPLQEKYWLNWNEAAALSGIPKHALKKLVKEGEVVARKFGRSWRVGRRSLAEHAGLV
jgi:DNA-binding transcriptional MerR regulator